MDAGDRDSGVGGDPGNRYRGGIALPRVPARQSGPKKAAASHELAHSVVVCSRLDTALPIRDGPPTNRSCGGDHSAGTDVSIDRRETKSSSTSTASASGPMRVKTTTRSPPCGRRRNRSRASSSLAR